MDKILITGSNGQLGSSFKKIAKDYDFDFTFTDVDELDITNEKAIDSFLKDKGFSFLVNCAAYTAVDKAEDDYNKALLLNATAPYLLAKYCKKYSVQMIHVSTDYVFNGNNSTPYTSKDKPNPNTVYGKTKLEGERRVLDVNPTAKIIRTAWLYSEFGNNFVKTMIRLGKEKQTLNVVFDQIGTPTFATDLSIAIMKMIIKKDIASLQSIFHFTNEGVCSWYDFAKKIMEKKDLHCNVMPILSKDYPTKTPRPHYSVLDKSEIKQALNTSIPHWEDSLMICLKLL
jgi:dTDP-4-dehydrorhamnose reductase